MKCMLYFDYVKNFPHPFKAYTVGEHTGEYKSDWKWVQHGLMAPDDFGNLFYL